MDLTSDSPAMAPASSAAPPRLISAPPPLASTPIDVDAEAQTAYQLCATVWHAGGHASSGHYIADVRRAKPPHAATIAAGAAGASHVPNPAAAAAVAAAGSAPPLWQRFDDSFVRAVAADAPDAATKGYLFFYVHHSLVD